MVRYSSKLSGEAKFSYQGNFFRDYNFITDNILSLEGGYEGCIFYQLDRDQVINYLSAYRDCLCVHEKKPHDSTIRLRITTKGQSIILVCDEISIYEPLPYLNYVERYYDISNPDQGMGCLYQLIVKKIEDMVDKN